MKRLLPLLLLYFSPAYAVPVVPNFTQGSLNSTTRTTSNITETIVSTDYNSGHTYSIMGSNITVDGATMSPSPSTTTQSIDGTSYTWTGADLTTKPNWTLTDTTSGAAFQFSESSHGPGLQNVTTITRQIESESVVTSTSVFSQ